METIFTTIGLSAFILFWFVVMIWLWLDFQAGEKKRIKEEQEFFRKHRIK